jgi:hypothetical protein
MPRFEFGTRVSVTSTIFSRYEGDEGIVSRVIAHRRGKRTLDKYEVEFADGTRRIFWDIQLRLSDTAYETPITHRYAANG